MTRTRIVDQYPLRLPNLAESYELDSETKAYEFVDVRWEQTGDGQVHSTVMDVMRWMRNLSTGQVGGRALVGKMRQTEPLADGDPGYYGMGVGLSRYRGFDEVSHSGGWAGYNTHVAWYPKMDLATVVLCNSPVPDASARGYALMDTVLGSPNPSPGHDIPPPVPSIKAVPPVPLNTLVAGTYLDDSGHQFQLQRSDNRFTLNTFPDTLALSRLSEHLMAADNEGSPIYLAATSGARIVSTNPASTYTLAAPWKPQDIQRYVGIYKLQTSSGQLKVYPKQGKLYIRIGKHTYPMQPLAAERFSAQDLGVIRFEQDGRVLTSSLARNLRFVRAEPSDPGYCLLAHPSDAPAAHQQPEQVEAAQQAGHQADGQVDALGQALAQQIGHQEQYRTHQGTGQQWHPAATGQAPGQLRAGQGDEGDGASGGGGDGGQADGHQYHRQPRAFHRDSQLGRAGIAHLQQVDLSGVVQRDRRDRQQADGGGHHMGPGTGVERAGQPQLGEHRLVQVAGHQQQAVQP